MKVFALITSVVRRFTGVIQKFFVLFVYYDKLDPEYNFKYDPSEGMGILTINVSEPFV
ncbi:protein of unknown function [Paenibacillus alvei]|uniref:Uncharacterized protein n=1 Tax=Paenibacillus alvei TaxID=44250 RepID=A0A383RA18_PAEAL|nr:protein of unknown function [Paenibacillus alvei]